MPPRTEYYHCLVAALSYSWKCLSFWSNSSSATSSAVSVVVAVVNEIMHMICVRSFIMLVVIMAFATVSNARDIVCGTTITLTTTSTKASLSNDAKDGRDPRDDNDDKYECCRVGYSRHLTFGMAEPMMLSYTE